MQPGKPKKTTAEKWGQAILGGVEDSDTYLGHGEEEKKDEEKCHDATTIRVFVSIQT